MAAHNSPYVGFSHRPPPVRLSFQTKPSSEIDPSFIAIEVSLTFKHRILGTGSDDGYVYQRILGESTVCFPFRHRSIGRSLAAYFGNEFHRWMPALSPGFCGILSENIVTTAQRIGLTFGGAMVVTASMEVVEREPPPPPPPTYTGSQQAENVVVVVVDAETSSVPDFFPHPDDSSSKPRGLSREEIKRLKEERFENGGDNNESVCSVCLEKFLPGAKISPLPCSHYFHHGCISSWLEKSASCPLCRFDVTNHLATTCFYECSS